jgi:putative transcriptional regulator
MGREGVKALPLVRQLSEKQIRAMRARTRVSHAAFAAVLNTSVSMVQKWEIGEKRPTGLSLELLEVVNRKGIAALVQDLSARVLIQVWK